MNFQFNLMNHNERGKASLEDVIGIIGNQLYALGHTAIRNTADDHFITRHVGYNIIVEGFTPFVIDRIKDAYNQGARFICIATEEPTPNGFNHGRQKEMRWRQVNFPEAAKYFEAILCLVPGQHVIDWYNQWAPTAYIELGHAPTLLRKTNYEPEFDFGFFGSVSQRRYQILKRIRKVYNNIIVVHEFPTQNERDDAIKHCKVVLQLKKYDEMEVVSSSRCNTALNLGRPVLAEPHKHCKPWDEIIRFSASMDKFYDDLMSFRVLWKGIYADQYSKFAKILTPEVCLGEPLRKVCLDMTPPKLSIPSKPTASFPQRFELRNPPKTSVLHWTAPTT